MFPRHSIHTYIITLIRDSCFKYVDITNYFWYNLCPLIILFLIIQLFVRMCIYFNIGKHKPCCSKRKMRALSLMQEQRGYYHATVAASLIYPVRYIARIPSIYNIPSIYSISSTRQIAEYPFCLTCTKIFIEKRIFETMDFLWVI